MTELDDCRLDAETFEAWKEELGGKLEEMGDQDTVEEAFEKMRTGVWLHVYRWNDDELHIIRKVEMPEGDIQEYVFIFIMDENDKMQLNSNWSLESWEETYLPYIGLKDLTLTKDEAMEKLKAGIPITTPCTLYFMSQLHNDMVPELDGKEFVFEMSLRGKYAGDVSISDPLAKFHDFDDAYRYGYRKGGNDE